MLSWIYAGFVICFFMGRLYEIEKRADARETKRRAVWWHRPDKGR